MSLMNRQLSDSIYIDAATGAQISTIAAAGASQATSKTANSASDKDKSAPEKNSNTIHNKMIMPV